MDINGYEIFITSMTLPHLDSPWTTLELKNSNGDVVSFSFQREKNKTKSLNIAGYIQKSTWALTRAEAEGLNNSLNTTPSGTLTDGYGTTYTVIVDSWNIDPQAGINKYTFNMSLKMTA